MAGYLCVAENKAGTVEKLFSLTVQGKKKAQLLLAYTQFVCFNICSLMTKFVMMCAFFLYFTVPPRITGSKEEEVTVIEGHMVSLLCDVQAYPPPEITWTRDGQLLRFSTGISILPGQPLVTCNIQIIFTSAAFLSSFFLLQI